jgi:hypothetical protein
MTYGNRPAATHQHWFEQGALRFFQALEVKLGISDEQRYAQPQRVVTHYAITDQESVQDKTHIVLSWLLGHSIHLYELMCANLMSGVLLENSASPLRQALETSEFGSLSQLCGLDDNTREASFMCGLEGSNPEQAEAVEALILQVLEKVARDGVPQAQVDAVLHQVELHQREITGDHFPYGLQLLTNALSPMIHGGDPVAFLNLDPVLTALRADSQNPAFIPDLIRRWLLNNPHRVRIVMVPDPSLAARQLAAERAQLEARQAAMTAADKAKVIEQAQALQARQQTKDDPELLPKVGLVDVAVDLTIPEGTSQPIATYPATWFARGTNGIVYQKIILELPEFEEELLELFPLFCECVTEVGCGDRNYLETVAWQSAVTGGVNARISLRGDVAEIQAFRGVYSLSGKALIRNQAVLSELLRETLQRVHFDELPRLRELIAQLRAESDNSITSRGHQLAMTASTSGMNPSGALSHRWHGLAGIQSLKTLDDSLEDNTALAKFASQLERIRDQLLTMPRQFLIVSEAAPQDEIATALNHCWQAAPTHSVSPRTLQPKPVNTLVKQAWSTSTQVNFCAKAYSTVAATHPDAPILTVLGDFLRNGYLHTALRERGGAYGGGTHYDSDTSAFRFYSYRDPRLVETLADFDQSLEWLQNTQHESRELEEAILGVVSRIDRPGSPAGDAIKSFFGSLHGRTPAQRREFRQRVLNVTLEDLQSVAMTYLQPARANIAVLSDAKTLEKVQELELENRVL